MAMKRRLAYLMLTTFGGELRRGSHDSMGPRPNHSGLTNLKILYGTVEGESTRNAIPNAAAPRAQPCPCS